MPRGPAGSDKPCRGNAGSQVSVTTKGTKSKITPNSFGTQVSKARLGGGAENTAAGQFSAAEVVQA